MSTRRRALSWFAWFLKVGAWDLGVVPAQLSVNGLARTRSQQPLVIAHDRDYRDRRSRRIDEGEVRESRLRDTLDTTGSAEERDIRRAGGRSDRRFDELVDDWTCGKFMQSACFLRQFWRCSKTGPQCDLDSWEAFLSFFEELERR